MPSETRALELARHGSSVLPSVEVDSYNLEVEDDEGFVGDRASRRAFYAMIEKWREPLKALEQDPFGDMPADEVGRKRLDAMLAGEDPAAAAVLHSAIEEFAQELAGVTRRFLRAKGWKDTEAAVIGGGFSTSRMGQLAVARAEIILRTAGVDLDFKLIRNHPDDAGLIGAAHLMPAWVLEGRDALLAVDIGGTNIRAGVVETNLKRAPDLAKAEVWKRELWRHGDEDPKRGEAVKRLVEMLQDLVAAARKAKLTLTPVIGVACPGRIGEDGSIHAGAQNLPGNWEAQTFNLPRCIREAIPSIGDDETLVIMHNDAVVQGLSELPAMRDYTRWAALTIGTGLGNARYTNRAPAKRRKKA